MIRLQYILITLLGGLAMLASTSCTTDKTVDIPDDLTPEEHWITLQFVMSGETLVTRAYPTGGEDGDGREEGIRDENNIHDVNIFLHTSTTALLNSDSTTPLTHLFFNLENSKDPNNSVSFETEINSTTSEKIYKIKFRIPVEEPANPLRDLSGDLRFITLANIGKSLNGVFSNLEDLRTYIISDNTWIGSETNVSEYHHFVMTTAYETSEESHLDLTPRGNNGTKNNPYIGKTTLERMCARIEVMYGDDNLKKTADSSELEYKVISDATNVATVHIQNMLPVNIMSKPSFLFKKVTIGIPESWGSEPSYIWGGKEETINNIPSNYVIEPTTLDKGNLSQNVLEQKCQEWYGNTCTSKVKVAITTGTDGKIGDYIHESLPNKEFDINTKMAILGYANENTQNTYLYNSYFLTGIAFRGVYQPQTVYKEYSNGENNEYSLISAQPGDLTDNFTVWQYSPSSATNQSEEGNATMSTEKAVKESRSLYFTNKDALDTYKKLHPEDNAVVTEFPEGVITNDVEGNRYIGFVSYYNLWLRHFNDDTADPQQTYPMEYAIVRNNIYRVAISFNGPGDPTPTMREPDTMQARIFVRKWNLRKEDKPLEF